MPFDSTWREILEYAHSKQFDADWLQRIKGLAPKLQFDWLNRCLQES